MYEYLVGVFVLFAIWLTLFFVRSDLRKQIIWGSIGYLFVITLGWAFMTITGQFTHVGNPVIPGYWNPPMLFDLGFKTGGYGIEDGFFSFFVGGIATVIYELVTGKKIGFNVHHKHHLGAFLFGFMFSGIFAYLFSPNPIYSLVAFGFAGALFIWVVRRDLIPHSLFGGILFAALYFFTFLMFNSWFPHFVGAYYNLKDISGIMVWSVPFEEILYALSFGMLWTPIYEYEHGLKNKK